MKSAWNNYDTSIIVWYRDISINTKILWLNSKDVIVKWDHVSHTSLPQLRATRTNLHTIKWILLFHDQAYDKYAEDIKLFNVRDLIKLYLLNNFDEFSETEF